jgi:hypothetical protein
MSKIYGTIIGLVLGIIGSTIWVYADTIVHPNCSSLWKCSSSALFKFGPINFVIVMALTGLVIGLVIGIILDKR